jgi:hypothetical protein
MVPIKTNWENFEEYRTPPELSKKSQDNLVILWFRCPGNSFVFVISCPKTKIVLVLKRA